MAITAPAVAITVPEVAIKTPVVDIMPPAVADDVSSRSGCSVGPIIIDVRALKLLSFDDVPDILALPGVPFVLFSLVLIPPPTSRGHLQRRRVFFRRVRAALSTIFSQHSSGSSLFADSPYNSRYGKGNT